MTGDATAVARGGSRARLSDWVERITQDNPGMFTGPGTNTHLVGNEALLLLDPGEDRDKHFDALVEAIAEREVLAIIPSHSHPDHWPLAPRLASHLGAPVWAFGSPTEFAIDRSLAEGDTLEAPGVRLEVLHTPGHATDHLCFHSAQHRTLFSGDHVMGWSTSIIAPPNGNLRQYMHSLDRLRELDPTVLYPAHGDAILDPATRMREVREHRLERTEQTLSALSQEPGTPAELVERIYTDVDPRLHPAARMSLWAHLEALMEEGRVTRDGGDPLAAIYRLAE